MTCALYYHGSGPTLCRQYRSLEAASRFHRSAVNTRSCECHGRVISNPIRSSLEVWPVAAFCRRRRLKRPLGMVSSHGFSGFPWVSTLISFFNSWFLRSHLVSLAFELFAVLSQRGALSLRCLTSRYARNRCTAQTIAKHSCSVTWNRLCVGSIWHWRRKLLACGRLPLGTIRWRC